MSAVADYVDPDAHVWETDQTWDYLARSEARFRPLSATADSAAPAPARFWLASGTVLPRRDGPVPGRTDEEALLFPAAAKTLADPSARLAVMDEFGIGVQVLHSTFWTMADLPDPAAEIALAGSYNRWMAERTEGSGGRLRWALRAPTHDVNASLRELDYGAAHGAVAVHLAGYEHDRRLSDPKFFPIYERAAELGLTLSVHVGIAPATMTRFGAAGAVWDAFAPVAGAFYALVIGDIGSRFPGLRWSFCEAGGAWLPWVAALAGRVDATSWRTPEANWRERTAQLLSSSDFFVTCWADDDLTALTRDFGCDNLTVSSNWGHYSAGSDPDAHTLVAKRDDLTPETKRKLVTANARRLFGLDEPQQTPAPA